MSRHYFAKHFGVLPINTYTADMDADSKIKNVELYKLRIQAWQKSIDVTMHFTDMSVKARQLGLGFAVGALALSVAILANFPDARLGLTLDGMGYSIHISAVVVLVSSIALWATRHLDLRVYHRMLRGSVAFTSELEATNFVPAP